MAMLIGVLSWLEKHQLNFALKFEESSMKPSNEAALPDDGGFKFPAWFTDSKHRLKMFEQNELKSTAKFDEVFSKVMPQNNFESLSQVLSKEDLELIKAPGSIALTRRHG